MLRRTLLQDRLATALLAGALFAVPLGSSYAQSADDSEQQLQETEAALGESREERAKLAEKREALILELRQLRQEMILAARDTQEREAIVSRLEDQLSTLENEKADRRKALDDRRQILTGTLGKSLSVLPKTACRKKLKNNLPRCRRS